jgi:lipopolysaccharide transport system ATP-binding protein
MAKVIKVEGLSKAYQLGNFGTGTISRDLERFWARMRGKEDPFLKIGELNDRTVKGVSDIVWSLKDLNFEIEAGDTVGIIGRNGAGKSTLLKILSRVTSPTTGSVKVKGRIASLLEVGTGFHPELSGEENIYLNGAILGMRKAEIKRKFDEIVDFSGVERYIGTPVKRYSSGMYVRLAFAVAAHLESEVLIVDEVLSVGDAEFQKKCLGKMGDVSKSEGRTVLFVSHNMESILNLCSKGLYLNNGQLFMQSTSEKVVSTYISENYQQSFVKNVIVALNHQVTLLRFSTSKKEYNVFEDIKFNIDLRSASANRIAGLSILIYNTFEKRVAIVDLRSIEIDEVSRKTADLSLHGTIKQINLIPGMYSLGLFLHSDLCSGDYLNILQIQIFEKVMPSAILPYPVETRGAAVFNHNLTINNVS